MFFKKLSRTPVFQVLCFANEVQRTTLSRENAEPWSIFPKSVFSINRKDLSKKKISFLIFGFCFLFLKELF